MKSLSRLLTESFLSLSRTIAVAASGNWILATGFWDDSGSWDDTATWVD